MDIRTGFMDLNGSGKDLINLYETRISGPTETTEYYSQIYDEDLGSIFYMNENVGKLGFEGAVGSYCGYKLINGTDIGSLFCVKGTLKLLDPSLVFHYKFNEGNNNGSNILANYSTGTAVYDATISNGTGNILPTIDVVNKKFGTGSMNFPGGDNGATTGGYLKLPSFTNDLNGLSFCCWIQATSANNPSLNTRIFDFSTNTTTTDENSQNGIALFTQAGLYIKGSGADVVVLPNDLTGSSFKFVVMTVQCLNTTTLVGEVKLYVNGTLTETKSDYYYPSVMTRTFNLLGMGTYSSNAPFKGKMDDFRLYKRVLNSIEVSNLYATNNTGPMAFMPYLPEGSVGLYACKWVNNLYTGPILRIRNGTNGTIGDFYMNSTGTAVGTAFNGTGTSLTTWLSGATAYVNTWYNQGNGKHAIQANGTLQPVYSQTKQNIYFGVNNYLIIDNYNVSMFSAGNIPYTITFKTGLASELSKITFSSLHPMNPVFSSGVTEYGSQIVIVSNSNVLQNSFNESPSYINITYNRTATDNEVVTASYNSNRKNIYLNGNLVMSEISNNLNLIVDGGAKTFIGYAGYTGIRQFTGSIEYLYVNNTLLSDANRLLMESVGDAVVVPTNGLVFKLTFGSSTIPPTGSIGGSTLTPITNASYPSTPAMVLDETRGYVLATDIGTGLITSFVPGSASWSRCFWLKKNTTGGSGNTLSSLNYPVYFPTLTKIQIDLNYSGPVTTVLDTTDRGLNWVHYVFTYDSTTKVCVLYVNGNAVVNATTGTIATETQSLCIGNLNQSTKTFGANQYFDDIYCYDRALTSTEVFSIYYNGKV